MPVFGIVRFGGTRGRRPERHPCMQRKPLLEHPRILTKMVSHLQAKIKQPSQLYIPYCARALRHWSSFFFSLRLYHKPTHRAWYSTRIKQKIEQKSKEKYCDFRNSRGAMEGGFFLVFCLSFGELIKGEVSATWGKALPLRTVLNLKRQQPTLETNYNSNDHCFIKT